MVKLKFGWRAGIHTFAGIKTINDKNTLFVKKWGQELSFLLDKKLLDGVPFNVKYRFIYEIDLQLKNKFDLVNSFDINKIKLVISYNDDEKIIIIKKVSDDEFKVTWENIDENIIEDEPNGFFIGKMRIKNLSIDFDSSSNKLEGNRSFFNDLKNLINSANELFRTLFSSLHYLGPLRGEPEREYIYRDEVLEIGNKGENAAYLFLTELNKEIENHYFYNKQKDDFKQIDKITLEKALAKWFNIIGVKDFAGEVINKIIYLSLNANKSDKTKVGIADVGFGISQIFPIFLEGLRMEVGSTLMLEQPEIHLHPNLQMQLSDFFIALAKSGKRFLVETHSDHVVNRLVRRIVEDETGSLKDLIGIYFIKPSDEGSVYEEITIDERKGIVNWPKDFFDQAANEQLKIMQAGLKKRHKNGQTI
ncbi:MAG: DUF3696 domain-containing protein [Saprospiraceae bacterium]|nr:DUF3696 domain-containing protein [Saprospiraceae bacterium]